MSSESERPARLSLGRCAAGRRTEKFGALEPGNSVRLNLLCILGWHVAPCLPVTASGTTSNMVFDPSMFTLPVPISTWVT